MKPVCQDLPAKDASSRSSILVPSHMIWSSQCNRCFQLNYGSLRSLASLTTKSIRKANDIEKMLREAEFDELLASGEDRERINQ